MSTNLELSAEKFSEFLRCLTNLKEECNDIDIKDGVIRQRCSGLVRAPRPCFHVAGLWRQPLPNVQRAAAVFPGPQHRVQRGGCTELLRRHVRLGFR